MWIASLADGRTVHQEDREGELSSWQQLREEGPQITQLRVQHGKVTLVGLPGARGYLQCTSMESSLFTQKVTKRKGLGSVISDQVIMNWVDESGTVWQEVLPLSDMEPHAILNN